MQMLIKHLSCGTKTSNSLWGKYIFQESETC